MDRMKWRRSRSTVRGRSLTATWTVPLTGKLRGGVTQNSRGRLVATTSTTTITLPRLVIQYQPLLLRRPRLIAKVASGIDLACWRSKRSAIFTNKRRVAQLAKKTGTTIEGKGNFPALKAKGPLKLFPANLNQEIRPQGGRRTRGRGWVKALKY